MYKYTSELRADELGTCHLQICRLLKRQKELVNFAAGEIFLWSNTVFHRRKIDEFFLFTAIRRSSTQLKISLNRNLLSIQALWLLWLENWPLRSDICLQRISKKLSVQRMFCYHLRLRRTLSPKVLEKLLKLSVHTDNYCNCGLFSPSGYVGRALWAEINVPPDRK
jgi:hypothetical protein